MHTQKIVLATVAALATTAVVACSSGEMGGGTTNEFGKGGAGHSTGAGKSSSGQGGSGGEILPSQSNGVGSGGATGSSGAGGACAGTAMKAQLVPVNLYIMLDKSGSMAQNNKWTNVTAALDAFFADPASAGMRVGLRFFPDTGCDGMTCDIAACTQPAVAIAALTADPAPKDAQEGLLVSTVAGKSPGGNTPMYAALAGAENYMADFSKTHQGERNAVLLATDGEPNGCDNNIAHIAQLATDGLKGFGLFTYVIGFQGSNQAQLDQIATAGGTKMSFVIGNGNAEAELVAALKAIQGTSVACDFAMPKGQNGMSVDPTLVNVDYTPGGGKKQTIGQVANAAACKNGGWYYDDPKNPTKITLCPSTCATVQADPNAEIDVEVGCQTIQQPIN